jgi:RNA polymerase sigma-70 factor (ECF subfamily)
LRAQVGDREAIEVLLRSVQPALTRYLRSLVGVEDAEDLSQDALVLIYRKLWTVSTPDLFRPWAYRIASRAAFKLLRKRHRWPESLRDDQADVELQTSEVAGLAGHVDELLQDPRLGAASRAVLALHFKEGMTLREVAAVLDVPLGTVKSRLAYGLTTLRRTWRVGEGQ